MEFDDICKYIGIFIVSVLVIYVGAKSIRFQLGIVESFVGKIKKTQQRTDTDAQAVDIDTSLSL